MYVIHMHIRTKLFLCLEYTKKKLMIFGVSLIVNKLWLHSVVSSLKNFYFHNICNRNGF